ncbi:MAG: VOC family protein [Chitinophagaceae bacterium]
MNTDKPRGSKHPAIINLSALLFMLLSAPPLKAQQKAGIRGIDHVGINVPSLKQAVSFFSEVLGFTAITQIGPITLDDGWKTSNRLTAATKSVTIKMVRAETGANIELFEYTPKAGKSIQPGGDNPAATHIAFYVDDINAATNYLKSKSVKVLGEPFLTPVGDTKGESWVYFETPWGSKMEFVSYPEGKEYEKKNPQVLLWSPKDVQPKKQPINNMSGTEILALVEQHLALWNEHDEMKRNKIENTIYSPDIEMVDRHFIATGHQQVDSFVKDLQQKNPGAKFTHSRPVDTHHNIARLFWQFGPTDQPAMLKGMDLFVMEEGKVTKLYVFVEEQ